MSGGMKGGGSEGMKLKKPVYWGRFSTFSLQMTQGWGLGCGGGGVFLFSLQMMTGWGLGREGTSHLFSSR